MKEHPIIFSAPMVRAILAGTKTQTRRVVKPQPAHGISECMFVKSGWAERGKNGECLCTTKPARGYCHRGDRLWVRETWYCDHYLVQRGGGGFKEVPQARELLYYRATDCDGGGACYTGFAGETMNPPWNSPLHMPRWASRITLEITGVRVERLNEISEADAKAEGAAFTCDQCGNDLDDEHGAEVHAACDEDGGSYAEGFHRLWNSLHGDCAFAENPWVWCISFRRV